MLLLQPPVKSNLQPFEEQLTTGTNKQLGLTKKVYGKSFFFYLQPWFDNHIAVIWLRCVSNVFVRFGGKLRQISEKKSKMELGSGTGGYQYPPSGSTWLLGFVINILDDLMTDCIIDLQSSWHFFGKTKEWKYHAKKVP